jgi:hypothetical protein
MVAIRRHRLSKTIQTGCHQNLAVLCSEAQFFFHLLNKSLAADAIDSDQLQEKVSRVTTLGDVPDKAGHEMTVGPRHRFSALVRPCFSLLKSRFQELISTHIRDLDQEINPLCWSDPSLELVLR